MKSINKIQHLFDEKSIYIFDFDGVLVDSNNIKALAFAELFKQHGDEVVRKVVDHHENNTGVNRYEKIRIYYKEFIEAEIDQEKIMSEAMRFSDIVVNKIIKADEIKGVSELLAKYHKSKKIFVNSATPEDELNVIVNGRNWPDFFVDCFGSPKSKEENIERILSKCGYDESDCVYFGDSASDYVAAHKKNIEFVAINTEYIKMNGKNMYCEYMANDFSLIK